MRALRLSVALGVIFVGLCAAWPFRQSAPERPAPPIAAPVELTLRRPDAPLELTLRCETSPAHSIAARGLDNTDGQTAHSVPSERLPELSNLAPPPAMPIAFQPIAENMRPTSWKPSLAVAPQPSSKTRPYRLRDGDTLERLAERFLGDGSRADEIFATNRHLLTRPDLLPVGVEIVLPPRQSASSLEPAVPLR